MDKDNKQLQICKNCKRLLNCNDAQLNFFYSCDLWIGDNEQKPSITITEDNSNTIQLEFDFIEHCNNEKE